MICVSYCVHYTRIFSDFDIITACLLWLLNHDYYRCRHAVTTHTPVMHEWGSLDGSISGRKEECTQKENHHILCCPGFLLYVHGPGKVKKCEHEDDCKDYNVTISHHQIEPSPECYRALLAHLEGQSIWTDRSSVVVTSNFASMWSFFQYAQSWYIGAKQISCLNNLKTTEHLLGYTQSLRMVTKEKSVRTTPQQSALVCHHFLQMHVLLPS